MNNKTYDAHATCLFILIVASCLTAFPVFSQSAKPRATTATDSSLTLARSLDPRLQHALNLVVSENQLQPIVALDREAALLSGKFSRRIHAAENAKSGTSSKLLSAQAMSDLGAKAGAAERKLFLALKLEQDRLNLALKKGGAVSLIQPLNLAGIETARVIRLRTGSMSTEIPGLGQAAVCRGDMVSDRLLYRYVRAATAEDDAEITKALRSIQIQLACMSTWQVRVFEEALVRGVEWGEKVLVAPAASDRRSRAIRDDFRQLFAPVVFATADASRLFAKHDQPAIKWLSKHQEMLAASALRENSIIYRVGLLFANRFSGKLLRVRGACAPGAKRIFKDGRGGLTCNPLRAFFRSSMLPCDVTQWVPENPNAASKFACDIACAGLPGSGTETLASGSPGSPAKSGCSFGGPQIPGGAGDSPRTPGGAGPGSSGSGGRQSCGGADPMYGVITGQQTPAEAYNNAYTTCLMGMAGQGHTSLAADAESTGYAPGGGAQCMLAAEGSDDQSIEDEQSKSEETRQQDANLEWAKEKVKEVLEGFVAVFNELVGSKAVTAADVEAAKTAIDNASFGECDGCRGKTSADGKTITIAPEYCNGAKGCFMVLLHEGAHSALTPAYHNEDAEHRIFGNDSTETAFLYIDWQQSLSPKFCPPEEPSCTGGCTSREAAAPDCMKAGLAASSQRLREMGQDAKDCAIDACWNPAGDDGMNGGPECGNPNACVGQSVALCTQDQPDCMCGKGNRGLDVGAILRNKLWRDYCARAYDERCSSPIAPGGFGETSRTPAGPRPPSFTTTISRTSLTFGGGAVTIYSDGKVTLRRPQQLRPAVNDEDCKSDLCRGSQRGDW